MSWVDPCGDWPPELGMADIGTLIDGGYVGINDEDCHSIPSQCYQTISKGKGKEQKWIKFYVKWSCVQESALIWGTGFQGRSNLQTI